MKSATIRIFTLVTGATFSSHAFADTGSATEGWQHMWNGGHVSHGGPMMIFGVLAVVAIIAICLTILFQNRSPNPRDYRSGSSPAISPIDVLKERFAKGEIEKKEYEDRLKILNS